MKRREYKKNCRNGNDRENLSSSKLGKQGKEDGNFVTLNITAEVSGAQAQTVEKKVPT